VAGNDLTRLRAHEMAAALRAGDVSARELLEASLARIRATDRPLHAWASLDEDGWQVVKPYIDEHKFNYRIIVATPEMAQLYGVVDALPTTFMIDQQGRIAATHTGLISKATYAKQIEQLLEDNHAALRAPELAAGKLADFRAN